MKQSQEQEGLTIGSLRGACPERHQILRGFYPGEPKLWILTIGRNRRGDSSVAVPSLCSGLRLTPQNNRKRRAQNDKKRRASQ
ncbi:MAG: hypothetical protein COS87_00410 [Chloroflexi bacterium CG07_land_8_20_14_0_80_45_17]|nr:MAG: hypothetical protein COX14_05170 [Chloroflexi bacterium CG23_combo_of_CG06-09_8_20_14_all_45_10]PIU57025.1 MAG: hypothetical protein COS87_00410 [Chloroflexi bacterium CG07_land_8_20_14_0_80_45_17]